MGRSQVFLRLSGRKKARVRPALSQYFLSISGGEEVALKLNQWPRAVMKVRNVA